MFYPDFEEVRKLAGDYGVIPVSMEVYADTETPISLFKRFEDSRYCFLLESVEGGEKWARFSFMGRNPRLVVKGKGEKIYIEDRGGNVKELEGNPIKVLEEIMKDMKGAEIPGIPRFSGGAVGFFGYDLIRHYENLPGGPADDLELPDCHLLLVDELIAYDHLKQKIHIISNVYTEGNLERNYSSAVDRIKSIYADIRSSSYKAESRGTSAEMQSRARPGTGTAEVPPDSSGLPAFEANIDRGRFCRNVEKAKEYIRNGDIFQVVLSQRLCLESRNAPFNVYRALRLVNPSPYMFYLKFGDYCLAGASPEMLVRVEDGVVETCPIAGTRKRGSTAEEDKLLEKELLEDEKELAEHAMLVDLGRNDIGRVSEFGTVEVRDFMHVEKYSHVMHIVSAVKGRLSESRTQFDALMSVFPAGTLSGAPKVRAMEIIDELETTKRGTYGGAVGYLGFGGSLDSCIAIRSVVFVGGKAYIQAGAGIVADSVPEAEYEESLSKAKAVLKAMGEAGGFN